MQAMRQFSQFLQGGEGESLSPQLRARILAAVPETVPAPTPATARRSFNRPVLAWGAVASALLLCVVLTPLFLKNNSARDMTLATAVPQTSSAKDASVHPGDGMVSDSSTGANNTKATGAGAGGSMAGAVTSAAQPASPRLEMKTESPMSMPPAPAAPSQRYTANAPGVAADKSASTEKMAAGKSASGPEGATSVTKIAPEPQQYLASKASANSDRDVVLAQNNAERAAVSSAERANRSVYASPRNRQTPHKTVPAATTIARRDEEAGDILLLVGNVEQSRATLEQAVKSSGGAITSVKNITYGDNSQAAMLTLNVPASRLPALLSELDAIGEREPFVAAFQNRLIQSQPASGAATNDVPTFSNGTADAEDNSRVAFQSRPAAHSARRVQKKPNVADTLPATANREKSKAPADAAMLQSSAHITIHLQERPKR